MNIQKMKVISASLVARFRRHPHIFKTHTFSTVADRLSALDSRITSMGSGSFGEVVLVHDKIVMKVCKVKHSIGYLTYVRYCRDHAHKNPILPKVFRISIINGFALIFMERLAAPNGRETNKINNTCKIIKSLCKKRNTSKLYHQALKDSKKILKVSHRKMENLSYSLNSMIERSEEKSQHYSPFLDMHSGNLMVRVGPRNKIRNIVLTDPIAA